MLNRSLGLNAFFLVIPFWFAAGAGDGGGRSGGDDDGGGVAGCVCVPEIVATQSRY